MKKSSNFLDADTTILDTKLRIVHVSSFYSDATNSHKEFFTLLYVYSAEILIQKARQILTNSYFIVISNEKMSIFSHTERTWR